MSIYRGRIEPGMQFKWDNDTTAFISSMTEFSGKTTIGIKCIDPLGRLSVQNMDEEDFRICAAIHNPNLGSTFRFQDEEEGIIGELKNIDALTASIIARAIGSQTGLFCHFEPVPEPAIVNAVGKAAAAVVANQATDGDAPKQMIWHDIKFPPGDQLLWDGWNRFRVVIDHPRIYQYGQEDQTRIQRCIEYAFNEVLVGDEKITPVLLVQNKDGRLIVEYTYDSGSSIRTEPDFELAFGKAEKYILEGTPERKTNRMGANTKGTRAVPGVTMSYGQGHQVRFLLPEKQ